MATFEERMDELERVVARMEVGGLGLAETVDLFERGTHLAQSCKAELESAENRLRVLVQPETKGKVRTEELEVDLDGEDEDEDYGPEDEDEE